MVRTVRPRLPIPLALVVGLALAAAPASSTVVAEDPCGPGAGLDAPTAPWMDLCRLTFASEVGAAGGPTTLRVSLELAGDVATRAPSSYAVRWTADGCSVQLQLRDERPGHVEGVVDGAQRSLLRSDCGSGEGVGQDCALATEGASVACLFELPGIPVAAPEVQGSALTWTLTFSGHVAAHAGPHAPGTVLDGVFVSSADATTQYDVTLVCGGASSNDSCSDTVGDRMRGETSHTVG